MKATLRAIVRSLLLLPHNIIPCHALSKKKMGCPRKTFGTAPTDPKPKCLGRLVGAFKTTSTKEINRIRGTPWADFWQRNFHDRIIPNDADLHRIREYIRNNPLQWALDNENPANLIR